MAKAATLRRPANGNNEPPAGVGHNVMTEEQARAQIKALGLRVKQAEQGLILATKENKASKADSMITFAQFAEQGIITTGNFPGFYLLWRYPEKDQTGLQVQREHKAEMSRFRKVVATAIAANRAGSSFITIMDDVKARCAKMQEARKAKKGDKAAQLALPEPKQADLAIYAYANAVESKDNGLLTEDEIVAAITRNNGVVPFVRDIKSMLANVNVMLDSDKAGKAGYTIDDNWRGSLRDIRNSLEEIEGTFAENEA